MQGTEVVLTPEVEDSFWLYVSWEAQISVVHVEAGSQTSPLPVSKQPRKRFAGVPIKYTP